MPHETQPKRLTAKCDRENARRERDSQWDFMERVAALPPQQPLWVCWWNKNRHHDYAHIPLDLLICGLSGGMVLSEWLNSHKDWWIIGEWSDARYAAPVTLTDAGRAALANRAAYDMEPVTGGLVEPGWEAIPLPPEGPDAA